MASINTDRLALQYGTPEANGYTVRKFYPAGDSRQGWELLDSDGANLMIGGFGHVAPRKSEAVLEAYRRIVQDAS